MRLDFADVFAGVIGSFIGRGFLFIALAWLGCSIGALAMMSGEPISRGFHFHPNPVWLVVSPAFLFSYWFLLSAPFTIITFICYVREMGDDYRTAFLLIAVESLAVMAGWVGKFTDDWLSLTLAWVLWAVLVGMVGAGLWVLRSALWNIRARELGILSAMHAQRISEQETSKTLSNQRETGFPP